MPSQPPPDGADRADRAAPPADDQTLPLAAAGMQRRQPSDPTLSRCLLIVSEGSMRRLPLPKQPASLVIGRDAEADVVIADPTISRRHAVLHVGESLQVEDLGSANGTRVRDVPVEPGARVEIFTDDVVDVGAALLVVQHGSLHERPRRLCTHAYFESQVQQACDRSRPGLQKFAVARVRLEAQLSPAAAQEVLAAVLRDEDLMAALAPSHYELLLQRVDAEEVEILVSNLRAAFRARKGSASVTVACFPRDAINAQALLALASEPVPSPAQAAATPASDEPRRPASDSAPPGTAAATSKTHAATTGSAVATPTSPAGQPLGTSARPSADGTSFVFASAAMLKLKSLIERAADSTISVLLLGETGVGKEVLAELLHTQSSRRDKPLLRLNCAAFSESLLESELFGHERGSFTGAARDKTGLLESANRGTVFLDEVGDMPMSTQVKLLRVLEERKVMRIGGLSPRSIDIRVVAATHRDLEEMVAAGTFRQDLYYRMNGLAIVIPSLRERQDEILPLARFFIDRFSAERDTRPSISAGAERLLQAYDWPGNIRELRNVMERAVLLCDGTSIDVEHLPAEKMQFEPISVPAPTTPPNPLSTEATVGAPLPEAAATDSSSSRLLRDHLEDVEMSALLEAIERCGGNQGHAALALGISRSTLVRRLRRYRAKGGQEGGEP